MEKIAIIGASYLQMPLIEKAKKMGLETHVFAWEAGDPGEAAADYFYPISIIEKEKILQNCQEIKIDGICSIASDLAAITVNYVAANMGLTGNSLDSTYCSTNKHAMRKCFYLSGCNPAHTSSHGCSIYSQNIPFKQLQRQGNRRLSSNRGKSWKRVIVKPVKSFTIDKKSFDLG